MIMGLRDGTVYSACFKIAATDRQGRESIMLDMSRFDLNKYYSEDRIQALRQALKHERIAWLSQFEGLEPFSGPSNRSGFSGKPIKHGGKLTGFRRIWPGLMYILPP